MLDKPTLRRRSNFYITEVQCLGTHQHHHSIQKRRNLSLLEAVQMAKPVITTTTIYHFEGEKDEHILLLLISII